MTGFPEAFCYPSCVKTCAHLLSFNPPTPCTFLWLLKDFDLLESIVDGAIDGLHRDLQPGRGHWLRQVDDVPLCIPLSFE